MPWQNFVNQVGPVVDAAWLNLVDLLRATVSDTVALPDGDTTPSVDGIGAAYTANTAPTSITVFDDGIEGQVLELLCTDADTTFVHGAELKTNTGANVASAADRIWRFKYLGGVWYMF